ncbi:MAG: LamG domain-containing protein, partial [Planctomycetes bacterium]|nr:LamG domain-containing protein [Planctomycetota bacterium]
MCRRWIYLVFPILVLGAAPIASADLVGHWKLDEGSGIIAYDSSGNGHDGTIVGNPQWVRGVSGLALEFDGDDHVDLGNDPSLDITAPITIMIWARTSVVGETHTTNPGLIAKAESGVDWSWQLRYKAVGSPGYLGFQFNPVTGGRVWVNVGQNLEVGEWYHIAGVANGTDAICYLNGEQTDRQPLVDFVGGNGKLFIGYEGWVHWYGAADEVRIYDTALTQAEIQQAMIGVPPGAASKPSPADEATDVPREGTLSWTPGEFAAPTNGHKVYFGQSFNDVNDATGGVAQDAN